MSKPIFRKGVGQKAVIALLFVAGIYVAWVAAWSHPGNSLEPVRLGVDPCYHCGMIVSDIRYSISVLDKDEQGHTVTRQFDDPGCFQIFAKQHPNGHWVGIAHDYRTGQIVPLDQALFTKTTVDTPMGSGIVVTHR